jgi:hypothetical protein
MMKLMSLPFFSARMESPKRAAALSRPLAHKQAMRRARAKRLWAAYASLVADILSPNTTTKGGRHG